MRQSRYTDFRSWLQCLVSHQNQGYTAYQETRYWGDQMTSDVLAKALKERDNLRSRLEKVEAFIELHNEFSERSAAPSHKKTLKVRRRKSSQPQQIAASAEQLIRSAGRPLTRGELAEKMKEAGITIESSDIPRYIGTVLWRMPDKFENVEDGYWLVGVTRPPL